jgi:hypothetical protein
LTPNTKRFTFELPSKDHTLGLSVSSLVLAKLPDAATGKDVVRPYTPVTESDKKGSFDMVIKIYEKVCIVFDLRKGRIWTVDQEFEDWGGGQVQGGSKG